MRAKDEPIPLEELLYRSILPEDVEGEHIIPHAVEMPACSFNRGKYSRPEDVLSSVRPRETVVTKVGVGELPEPFPRQSGEICEFHAEDDPLDENPAHCEVRLSLRGRGYSRNLRNNKNLMFEARARLASRLRIHH